MPKITKKFKEDRPVVQAKTRPASDIASTGIRWWKAASKEERGREMLATASFLKDQLQYRQRQASIFARLYGNIPLMGIAGSAMSKITPSTNLPLDRPTMNVVQSCVDTLVSRITQSRPRPVFLTDNGDYKQRTLAKQLNAFIGGELYKTKAYELAPRILTDAAVLGDGIIKVYEDTGTKEVALERVLSTELLVDSNDGLYGAPRQIYQLKLVDRSVVEEMFPDAAGMASRAEQAYPDNGGESSKTVSDQIMLVEGWRLPSAPDAGDGKHMIACTSGVLFEEDYTKDFFPFVFMKYSPRMLGFFAQPLTEQLMGTQIEINRLLVTISKAINLVGVPRVFVEDGSKVVKAHLNNEIGSIVTYRGTKPEYEVAPVMPQEVYAQLQRLVEYAYQQSGISSLAATSQKPAGLDSGQAIREYDDLQSDRFAALNKRYDNMFVDLAYLIVDKAKDIAKRDGKYSTVYPNKNGTQEIDLPKASLLQDKFVIKCLDSSSLPKDPAGRKQEVVDMIQSGMVSIAEGRRLLDFPDLEQAEKLANAAEERILKILDEIVEDGKYTPPDEMMDVGLATKLANQYYNLYVPCKLEQKRADMLLQFNAQCVAFQQEAMSAMQPQGAPNPQMAQAQPLPQSPLIPQTPNQPA